MNAAAQSGLNNDSLDGHHSQDSLEADSVELPELDFKHLPLNQRSSYYQTMLRSVPATGGFMRQKPLIFQPNNMYNLIASPYIQNRKRFREVETAFPIADRYATNEQSPLVWNYPLVDNTSDQLPELPSFQIFDSLEEPGGWGTQQSTPMSELDSENTLVQSPLTDQTPPDYSSSRYDGLLESIVYRSSGKTQTTDTDSEYPPLQSYLLSHTELTPASVNTTGNLSLTFYALHSLYSIHVVFFLPSS